MRNKIFFLLFALLYVLPSSAQQGLSVKSFEQTIDQTANLAENLLTDNNGNYCGLVKVRIASPSAEFQGQYVKETRRNNASEYWVFMTKCSRKLTVIVPGFLPLDINIRDYFADGIESKVTYLLTVNVPQTGAPVDVDDGMRYLTMTVEPKNSTVFVDNQQQTVENGEVSVYVSMGTHRYQVSAPGYATKEGAVEVGDNTKTVAVKLVSTQATLRVECATKGAQVYVNGQQRGTAPWSGQLSPGNYKVEARLDGYRKQQQNVALAQSDNRTVTLPELQMIAGRLNVNCRPLGSDVYVDGKKVGTSPNVFRNIQVGNRRVEIRKDGYQTLSQTVTIKENEQFELKGTLTANATASPSSPNSPNSPSSSQKETFTVNGVSFTMIRVDGGTFTMGATPEQGSDATESEKPAHKVTLSTYMIGETEVTQALWQAVMGNNPSSFTGDKNLPVEKVSWNDCQAFIKKLNQLTGKNFRLPTEAEWEFAARGGNKSKGYKYSGSNTFDEVAWSWENSGDQRLSGEWDGKKVTSNHCKTHPVKTKKANELGLYDMSGNVWEWCSDWKGSYGSSAQTNPQGSSTGSVRVFRGGGWGSRARSCRVSIRSGNTPGSTYDNLGLRLGL